MDEYYCPNCGADLSEQDGFDPSCGTWTCTSCGTHLMDDDIYEGDSYEGVAWYCDECGALLNRQSGFSDSYDSWVCTECGHSNGLTEDDIYDSEEDYEKSRKSSSETEPEDFWTGLLKSAADGFCEGIRQGMMEAGEDDNSDDDDDEDKNDENDENDENDNDDSDDDNDRGYCGDVPVLPERKQEPSDKYRMRSKRVKAFLLHGKKIPLDKGSAELIGKTVREVSEFFTEQAFTKVKTVALKDIYIDSPHYVGEVERISVKGKTDIQRGDRIPYSTPIEIFYHDKREITLPFSIKKLNKTSYINAEDVLKDLGFTEIYEQPIYDLKTGWLKHDGTIEKIVIEGRENLRKKDAVPYDAHIVIYYHALKRKHPPRL